MHAISFYSTLINTRFCIKPLAYAIGLVGTLGIAGCGSSGDQDNGSTPGDDSSIQDTISGVAVDGHVARATVFVDSNNNGSRETFEVSAFTDDDGYFSYNPELGIDYCASDASAEDALYCLRYQGSDSEIVIRIDGGYDILTGEPFYGQMSRRINPASAADRVSAVVSPLTTLATSLEDSEDQAKVMAALGIKAADLDIDYLNTNGADAVDSNLFNIALKVHKTVSLLGDLLDDGYSDLANESGLPNNGAPSVYNELARSLTEPDAVFDMVARDPEKLATILDNAESQVRAAIEQRNLDLPEDLGTADNSPYFSIVTTVAARIPELIDQLVNPMDTGNHAKDVLGASRALEVVVIKALQNTGNNQSAQNAVDFVLNADNAALVDRLKDALTSDKADLDGLVNTDFSGDNFQSAEGITNSAQLPADADAFSDLAGMSIKISDQDFGTYPNGLDDVRDIEVELYFQGTENSLKGDFTACVKYIDGADTGTGELGEGNTRGELVNGQWSLMGATAGNPQSYNLILTLKFLGAVNQAIVKPAGSEMREGKTYQRIRFDFDGEITSWLSDDGLVAQTSVPQSNGECAARLPSRVGL